MLHNFIPSPWEVMVEIAGQFVLLSEALFQKIKGIEVVRGEGGGRKNLQEPRDSTLSNNWQGEG